MDSLGKTFALEVFFISRIYSILSAIGGSCLISFGLFAQEINAYRTIASGNFTDLSIWETYDGIVWNPAVSKPTQLNDIYIDQTHTLTLTQNEEAKSVFINAETSAGQKLNLNGFNLDIYGSLQAFEGPAPGIPNQAWNSQNWIGNSINSTITFRGNSRTIIPQNAWSAQSDRSRYVVIFDPGPGVELTIEEAFKSLSFTIRSGTVIQKLDKSVIPAKCATFSFNTETTVYGAGPFGTFTIESGARLISECNEDILFRSASLSASLLDVWPDGELILEGNAPLIEAASIQLNGKLIYRGGTSLKSYLSKSYPDAAVPQAVNNLQLDSNFDLTLPSTLFILGNMEKVGSGTFLGSNSHLHFVGAGDQEILGFSLETQDLSLNKFNGELSSYEKLQVSRNLNLLNGSLDLNGNDLEINSSLTGGLNYTGGTWKNIDTFTYHGTPLVLNQTNATFPYEDTQNGGIRKVQLLGNSAGGSLEITFNETKGADFNAGFNDSDGTPILYRLYSYFQFSGLNPSSNPLEMRISAHQLIVDNEDDLRIVGTGYAASGSHLAGLDPTELWARRNLTVDELEGTNFTIGSFRTATVLPITWLEFQVKKSENHAVLNWKISGAAGNEKFEIFRTENLASGWQKIGEITGNQQEKDIRDYEFVDKTSSQFRDTYYQIHHLDHFGKSSWSKVILFNLQRTNRENNPLVYPNPYQSGLIHLNIPSHFNEQKMWVQVADINGKIRFDQELKEEVLISRLLQLERGLYLIRFYSSSENYVQKWIKE
ncbi:T9SS type A sorting domain-containing protein [Algoriphagus sp. CAU 1675]|uniref:T9SS type A sorting domain-containing protein n=1 Tax=Algoriphagus sp. CAU 1675 TaxID=3032597 RepID=UPI0023DA40B4|nr:T9SS type A sorting domain-containing protein [Algoriphagus sp. CAU 1675]MDF2158944.1 T9SS type A sorting domain-containing protein [Algoriphagus sp. CAU 1675]